MVEEEKRFFKGISLLPHRKTTQTHHTHTRTHAHTHAHTQNMHACTHTNINDSIIHVSLCERLHAMFHNFFVNVQDFYCLPMKICLKVYHFSLFYVTPRSHVCISYQPAFSQIRSQSQHAEASEQTSQWRQSFCRKQAQSLVHTHSVLCQHAVLGIQKNSHTSCTVSLSGAVLVTLFPESPPILRAVQVAGLLTVQKAHNNL